METLTHKLTGCIFEYQGLVNHHTMQLQVIDQKDGKYKNGTVKEVPLSNLSFYKSDIKEPKLYFVLYLNSKGKLTQFETNDEHTALGMELRRGGDTYIDNRHAAKLRVYYWLCRKFSN